MDEARKTAVSKFFSYALRHAPEAVGIELDAGGWVEIEALLAACARERRGITRDELVEIVSTSPKQRFAISEDGLRIRANQGHSTEVDLGYEPSAPPVVLFHGTVASAFAEIRAHGLKRMARHHVHLSRDEDTALSVGSRRGKPVLLRIDARAMHEAGHVFYVTPNGVWLTDNVPREFISGCDDA